MKCCNEIDTTIHAYAFCMDLSVALYYNPNLYAQVIFIQCACIAIVIFHREIRRIYFH